MLLKNYRKKQDKNILRIFFYLFAAANLVVNTIKYFHLDNLNNKFNWATDEMLMNYKYGFVRRGLMGSVSYLLSTVTGIDSFKSICIVQFAGEIIFCLSIVLIVLYFIKSCENRTAENIVILLFSVFLQLCGFGFYFYDWGEPDIYMIALTLLSVYLILEEKGYAIVILCCCLSEMIHEGFALMYFPIVFALLFFSFIKENDKKLSKKKLLVLILATLATAALFIYFYFFSTPIKGYTFEEVVGEMQEAYHREFPDISIGNIKYIWYGIDTYSLPLWENGKPTLELFSRVYFLFCAVLTCLPSWLFFFIIWISRAKRGRTVKEHFAELAVFFSISTVIPLLAIQADTARWVADAVLYECVILSVMTIKDGEQTTAFFEKHKLLNNNVIKIIFILYVVITSFLLKYDKWAIFDSGFIRWLP